MCVAVRTVLLERGRGATPTCSRRKRGTLRELQAVAATHIPGALQPDDRRRVRVRLAVRDARARLTILAATLSTLRALECVELGFDLGYGCGNKSRRPYSDRRASLRVRGSGTHMQAWWEL